MHGLGSWDMVCFIDLIGNVIRVLGNVAMFSDHCDVS